jgi:hypothetical protein
MVARLRQRIWKRKFYILTFTLVAKTAPASLYTPFRADTMPGPRISGNDIPATDLIWTFFEQHPKP